MSAAKDHHAQRKCPFAAGRERRRVNRAVAKQGAGNTAPRSSHQGPLQRAVPVGGGWSPAPQVTCRAPNLGGGAGEGAWQPGPSRAASHHLGHTYARGSSARAMGRELAADRRPVLCCLADSPEKAPPPTMQVEQCSTSSGKRLLAQASRSTPHAIIVTSHDPWRSSPFKAVMSALAVTWTFRLAAGLLSALAKANPALPLLALTCLLPLWLSACTLNRTKEPTPG